MKKALLLFSAGKESVYNLHKLYEEFGSEITLLIFDYGQDSYSSELRSAIYYAEKFGLDIIERDSTIVMPDAMRYGGVGETEVPFRNGIFTSYAVNIAISQGHTHICIGCTDSGDYGDGDREFVTAFNTLLQGMYDVKIISYTKNYTGVEIAIKTLSEDIDDSHIWSCMTSGEKMCGKCAKCLMIMGYYVENINTINPKYGEYLTKHYGLRTF